MEIGMKLTQFLLTGLVIIGYGKFFTLIVQVIFESLKEKMKER